MDIYSPEKIKNILKKNDLTVLKQLGQHFLIDEKVLLKIIKAADLNKDDMVVEIGPGLGILTRELALKCHKVITVEKDGKMVGLLRKNLERFKNAEIIEGDILKINLEQVIKSNQKYKIVANIPYYITSPIMKLFLESSVNPKEIILLVQKEVAERICGAPGKMSVLALSVQIYGEPKIIDFVSKNSFWPPPKVDSAILKISNIKSADEVKKNLELENASLKNLFRIIKIGFSSKRKKLANNLSVGLDLEKEEVLKIFEKLGINKNVRAQELSLEEWTKLTGFFLDIAF